MSQVNASRNKFKIKPKLVVGKVKYGKKRTEDSNNKENDDVSDRRSDKRFSRSSSKDGIDRRGGYGGGSSDLKRKRTYAERGVEKGGDDKNGGVSNRKSLSRKEGPQKDEHTRRKSSAKDDISEYDRLNRMKFSSSKGKNTGKSDFGDERSRKKDHGSLRSYKERGAEPYSKSSFSRGKDGLGSERSFDDKIKPKIKTRDRWVSSKQDVNEGSDGKTFSQDNVRDRWQSKKRDDVSGSKLKIKDKTRDEKSDNKLNSQAKVRDRWPSKKQDAVSDSKEEDGSRKQQSRNKTDSNKQADQKTGNKHEVGTLERSTKKKLRSKKYGEENSLEDGPPKKRKKKKKHMGIHPYDVSSKRVDDGISVDDKTVENEVDSDKDTEISKNAQFRSIQPSPSILSFVEDNLLGRRRSIDLRRAGYNIDLSTPLDNIPLSTSSERERIEEAVFRNKLEFFAAAKVSSSFPPAAFPEIAFAGRSNVGKSSLLNALTRQWGVVRTSDKPGLTQTINFFKLGPKLCMVDLPGYGFAYAKEEVKDAWEELVKEYVSTRVGLKRVCLLIDTKWGMKPRDQELINLMERSQTKYQIVLTKTDTVFPLDVARRAMQIEETLKANKSVVQPVMMVSSKSGGGIRSLRTVLGKIARFAKL